jgi:Fic family protein
LQIREVGVSNGFVIVHRGTPAAEVSAVMARFENTIQTSLAILDGVHEEPDSNVSAEDKIRFAVRVACELFIELQGIHPYLDGNGHMGRFLIWVILGRYGYWPIRWRIEPRPVTQPDYISLIQDYKAGRPDSLQNFIYSCIDPIDPCPPLVVN